MERKTALITGITGQDGSFLAELLLEKGYDVHGTIRRSSVDYRERIAHLEGKPNFHLHYADLTDSMSMLQVVSKVRPTEIYNLAAQSHVQVSFDSPEFTANVDATGVQHSVREFCYLAFKHAGIELEFKGEGINEKGYDKATGRCLVEVSEDFYRPTDVVNLWGDPTKAKAELGWDPNKTTFEELVKIMVDADMAKVAVEKAGEKIRTNLAEYLEKGIVK